MQQAWHTLCMSIGHTGKTGLEDEDGDIDATRNERGRFVPGKSGNPKGGRSRAARSQARMDALEQASRVVYANRDGWESALTGIGTDARDKRKSHKFASGYLPYDQIAKQWEQDDITAMAIEARAQECFSRGYEITIADEGKYEDLKEEVEEHLGSDKLALNEALAEADHLRRAFGGSAVLLGTDDGRSLDEPLELTKARSVEWLNVFEPLEVYPVKLFDDWESANYGKPELFQVTPFELGGANFFGGSPKHARLPKEHKTNLIHASRLLVFRGIRVSRYFQSVSDIHPWWGSSTVPRYNEQIRDMATAFAAIGVLATDVSQPIIMMQGLREMVANHREKFRDRMAAIEMSRSIARAIYLDADKEKYERQTTQLTGIPELIDRISQRCAAAIGVPLSIMLGYSPATLGTPGSTELDRWHDIIRSMQSNQMTPYVRRVAKMVMRSMRQRRLPKKWSVDWHDLKHLSAKDQAELELTQARADTLQVKNGAISSDEIRVSRWRGGWSQKTQINENKKAPGFMAPLPAGVVPGSTPGVAGKPGAPAPAGPNAHAVTGYARRNPTQTVQNPKVGGDTAPADNRDAQAGDIIEYAGFSARVESPRGSVRKWTDTDGTPGETRMPYDYGELLDTLGTDGDPVDAYFGPSPDAPWVYVVHQMSKSSGFAEYDEDKVMLGFDSPNHARDAYLRMYDDERFFGSMEVMSLEDFRKQVTVSRGRPVQVALDESEIIEHLDRIEERDGKWVVLSEDKARALGTYDTEDEAIHRLAQVERFKVALASTSK